MSDEKIDPAVTAAKIADKAAPDTAKEGHPKDFGDWKFKPWAGLDHWVQDKTNASTFKDPGAGRR